MHLSFTYKSSYLRPSKRPENTAIFQPLFSGKEKDSETGYHYFGARYYNSDLSLWLSVDPMADKYPSLSPYNYCAWNPLKIVDPDGMDTLFSFACNTKDKDRNKNNSNAVRWFRGIGDEKDLVSLAMHGEKNKVQMSISGSDDGTKEIDVSATRLADIIDKSAGIGLLPTYENNRKNGESTIFILYSCETGSGDDCFASKLSGELKNNIIIAPAGKLHVSTKTTDKRHFLIKNIDRARKSQQWNVFVNGTKVGNFNGSSAPRSWIRKQGGIEKVIRKYIKN